MPARRLPLQRTGDSLYHFRITFSSFSGFFKASGIGRLGETRTTENGRFTMETAVLKWLRGLDLNQRPSGYEPDELPGCSTPRSRININATLPFLGQVLRASFFKTDPHHSGSNSRAASKIPATSACGCPAVSNLRGHRRNTTGVNKISVPARNVQMSSAPAARDTTR
jgi:hypothetical protein